MQSTLTAHNSTQHTTQTAAAAAAIMTKMTSTKTTPSKTTKILNATTTTRTTTTTTTASRTTAFNDVDATKRTKRCRRPDCWHNGGIDVSLTCRQQQQQQKHQQQHTQRHQTRKQMPLSYNEMLRTFVLWTFVLLLAKCCACQDAVSQFSPKSQSQPDDMMPFVPHFTTSDLTLESTMAETTTTIAFANVATVAAATATNANNNDQNENEKQETQSHVHVRAERSAQPILNENFGAKSGPNAVHFPSEQAKEAAAAAGRYFQYDIKPTGTYDTQSERPELTQRARAGKTLHSDATGSPTLAAGSTAKSNSFLLKGGLRPLGSGSPIQPTSTATTTQTTPITALGAAATATATAMAGVHNPRQNPNPDIQDIITGIVKLLNGNVNVHANTQGVRRPPTASRINNRGPPRISEVQTMPLDYDAAAHKPALGTSIRPPPYPFDRPERPFITGVPIPEQIVPYRPGFVSNRPPWHRQKPRPPITTTVGGGTAGGRRPMPQYQQPPQQQMHLTPQQEIESPLAPPQVEQRPVPPIPTQQQQQQQQQPQQPSGDEADYNDGTSTPRPTDATYDSEFSNEDTDTQYIEVSDKDVSDDEANSGDATLHADAEPDDDEGAGVASPASSSPAATQATHTDAMPEKKKTHKHKNSNSEKKKHQHQHQHQHHNHDYTTVIETSSEVHTVMHVNSAYMPITMESVSSHIDASSDEVIFMMPSKTPTLDDQSTAAAADGNGVVVSPTTISTSYTDIEATAVPALNADDGAYHAIEPTSVTYDQRTITFTTMPLLHTTITTTTATTTTTNTPTTTTTTATVSDNSNAIPSTPQPTPPPTSPPPPLLAQSQPQPQPPAVYHPRPGIVLDDPEFQPGGRPRPPRPQQQSPPPMHIQPTRQHLPPGYGEIFDVTLSAIQGPGGAVGGSQQTINIKPYGAYGSGGNGVQQHQQPAGGDIIVSASGEDGFVSIDGKRTYINLFGDDPTDTPIGQAHGPAATAIPQLPLPPGHSGPGTAVPAAVKPPQSPTGSSGSGGGYGISETEVVELPSTQPQQHKQSLPPTTNTGPPTRPHYRPRPTQTPVRIDTCIVGDDSTCDQAQYERCKTENGVSSCHCRPGYSRRKHREPCRKVISFFLGLRVDRIYERRIVWDNKLLDQNSEPYGQLSYETMRALDSAMSMTPYSDEFMEARVNNIYRGDPNLGGSGVFVNLTLRLDESVETLRPNLRSDVQKHLLGVLHRRNNNIGNSVLYVSSPEGAVSALHDLDECQSRDLNDCHASATCTNSWGSFRCVCGDGFRDPWADQPQRAGRECQSCADTYCNNHGTCSYNEEGNQVCACDASHYGGQCEIDGEVLGVAIGASVAAVIIIVLTLVCLIMWSRRWQREQKNAIGSPVFGYMNTAPLKSASALAQPGYQVTLEDRMRWAQIADVMAQTNHYGAEPIAPTRPSSAMFAYPNLQAMVSGMGGGGVGGGGVGVGIGGGGGLSTLSGLSMQSSMQQLHQSSSMAPPVPLPRYERLGLSTRSNGMRTLENSSSSEEEDRTDLLGRNFQVPRPKSRSNGSITNQSGIYYDVDYEPSGIGSTSVDHLYSAQAQSNTHTHSAHGGSGNSNHIPMSTYTSGRGPTSYFMK